MFSAIVDVDVAEIHALPIRSISEDCRVIAIPLFKITR